MPGTATVPSAHDVTDYMKRLATVQQEVGRRGWGAKKAIAFGTGIMPSRVSGVLLVREVNPEFLEKIERWLADNPDRRPVEFK